jgi:hypothetical protein
MDIATYSDLIGSAVKGDKLTSFCRGLSSSLGIVEHAKEYTSSQPALLAH